MITTVTDNRAQPAGFRHVTLVAGGVFCVCFLSQLALAELGLFGRPGSLAFLLSGGIFLFAGLVDLLSLLLVGGVGARVYGAMLALAVAASFVTQTMRWRHPTETLLGGYDEGVYAVAAVNLSHTGNYFLKASLLPTLPSALQPWIIKHDPAMAVRTVGTPPTYPAYHTCLFVIDQTRGELAPQFTSGFPVTLGSAFSFFDYRGLRAINFLVTLGAALTIGLLATTWLGKAAGAASVILMLWFPLHAWGANSLYAEPLVQLLWLLTLLGVAESPRFPRSAGLVTGLAAGLGLAVKIDALPVALLMALVGLWAIRRNKRFAWTLLGGLVASAGVSLFSWWLYDRSYVESTLRALTEPGQARMVAAGAGVIGLLLAAFFAQRWWEKQGSSTGTRSGWQHVLLAVGCVLVVGLAVYAYFFRPRAGPPDSFYYWPVADTILSHREETFLRLGWYWQPWGLAAAVGGICILVTRCRELWHGLFVGLGLLCLVSFCYDLRNNPLQPYAMRRFLPAATPLMILGGVGLWSWVRSTNLRNALTMLGAAGLAAGFFVVNERLCAAPEYPGIVAQVGQLAEKIPPNSVVLTPDVYSLARLATPLEFAFGKPCLVLRGNLRARGFDETIKDAIHGWQAKGKRVFFLSNLREDNFQLPGLRTKVIARGAIRTKATAPSAERLVLQQTLMEIPWVLNEVPPLSPPHSPNGPP